MRWMFFFFATSLILNIVACAPTSVLIKPDDQTFLESQKRMEHTISDVQQIDATGSEKALFLEAESFYRYRFEPPKRNTSAYLAEAAAAITDFPAFQSLAGSLNLLDMRLRASDSAVQLWETLLAHHPDTKLRPLTIYRLGWAYRYAGAEGLPRESPNEAFDFLIKESPNSKLASLAIEAKEVPWKSKKTAATRSLLPGLGQLYVGETKNGVIRLSVAVASAIAIAVPLYIATRGDRELKWDKDWPLLATGLGGLIVLSFDYTSSYEDAMRGVIQWNERAESKFNSTHSEAP
jgi:hypothetical protein